MTLRASHKERRTQALGTWCPRLVAGAEFSDFIQFNRFLGRPHVLLQGLEP